VVAGRARNHVPEIDALMYGCMERSRYWQDADGFESMLPKAAEPAGSQRRGRQEPVGLFIDGTVE
jgi:hypothetical protein